MKQPTFPLSQHNTISIEIYKKVFFLKCIVIERRSESEIFFRS